MICPFCASEDTQVKDSRPCEDGAAIRRRRFCGQCGSRFTTFERVQLREIMIVKLTDAGHFLIGINLNGLLKLPCASAMLILMTKHAQ